MIRLGEKFYITFINLLKKEKYEFFLNYAFSISDSVSFLISTNTNYERIKKIDDYAFVNKLYLLEEIHYFSRKIDFGSNFNGDFSERIRERIYLKLDDEVKHFLKSRKNIFDFPYNEILLEDPCFYKENFCWFETCSNNKDAGLDPKYFKEFKKQFDFKYK